MNAAFFDLERIEVLRGPQGTLYGRNATGGVINIISKRPTFKFEGYGAVTFGNYKTINGEGAINIPLSDKLALRASFTSRQHDGYRNNAIPAGSNPQTNIPGVGAAGNPATLRGDDEDTQGGRLQLLYKPTDRLTALLSATYIHQGGVGPVQAGYATTRPTPPTSVAEATNFALNTAGDYRLVRKNILAQIDYDFGPVKATYLFGFAGLDIDHLYDNDGTATGVYAFRRGEYSKDYSHEIRFASNSQGPLTWQFGGFFYHQNLTVNSLNFGVPNGTPIVLRNFQYGVRVDSNAGFGQIGYAITDKLKVTGGLRYSQDIKARTGGRWAGPGLGTIPTTQPALTWIPETGASYSKDSDLSYHAGIDYQASPRNLIYAKMDKGYKSGGFTAINAYGPETVLAYEIGSKNRLLGNRLQLNVSGFIYDYRDQQVSQVTNNGVQVLNAGRSRVKGLEAQVEWRVAPNDALDLSVNWLDAKYRDFAVNVSGVNVNQAGHRLVQAPEWAISAGYEHNFVMANEGRITPRAQILYRSEQYFTFFNNANDRQRAYANLDLSLSYTAPGKAWNVQAYVRNATNSVSLSGASIGSFSGTNIYQFAAPRTYGVRLQANF